MCDDESSSETTPETNSIPESNSMAKADLIPAMDLIPAKGRIIGIDFGTSRIGVAVTDPGQSIASPMETYQVRNPRLDGIWFVEVAKREQAVGFVVGLPLHMSGDASKKSNEAVAFGNWLREVTKLPVTWQDERYSTAMAREICQQLGLSGVKRKAHLDKIAAQVILSSWLELPDRNTDLTAADLGEKP
jgi:putative Holliday junction resolvase